MNYTKNFALGMLAYFAVIYVAAWGVMLLMDDVLPKWSYYDFTHLLIAITFIITAVDIWQESSKYFREKANE